MSHTANSKEAARKKCAIPEDDDKYVRAFIILSFSFFVFIVTLFKYRPFATGCAVLYLSLVC